MNAAEFRTFARTFRDALGENGHVHAGINSGFIDEAPLFATIYPNGVLNGADITVNADDWAALSEVMTTKWAEHAAAHRAQTVKSMALEIIRITNEHGTCTDAALRGAFKFSAKDIAGLGADACAMADEMAGKGPFSILIKGGANGAPEEEAA